MTLISICTVLCVFIFFIGTTRQYIVKSSIEGFSGKWKFKIDKKIFVIFVNKLIDIVILIQGVEKAIYWN